MSAPLSAEAAPPSVSPPPIAAVATAVGAAGVGILRLSGEGALAVARLRLAGLPAALEPRRLVRAALLDEAGVPLDDVLVVHFPRPHSYTGEEVVEIQAHGGCALLRVGLRAILSAGAVAAAPGEFTRRAVLNGRMDLLEAEALAAILEAEEEEELDWARRALRDTAPALRGLQRDAVAALAEALGSQDHPHEVALEEVTWGPACAGLAERCRLLAAGPALEARTLGGPRLLLLGPPNAGKSSLLNALLDEDRALVDPAPGTTRDLVEGPVRLAGRRAMLCDSAGIRAAEGLEAAGVARALAAAETAEGVLWIEDIAEATVEPPAGLRVDLRILSKCDLPAHPSRGRAEASRPEPSRRVSARSGEGLDGLRSWLSDRVRDQRPPGAATERQRRLLAGAEEAFRRAAGPGPEDLRTASLEAAVQRLGALLGEGRGAEEAAALVFRRFCLGK